MAFCRHVDRGLLTVGKGSWFLAQDFRCSQLRSRAPEQPPTQTGGLESRMNTRF